MEEILHHPGCIKPYEYINWCRFLPSTVSQTLPSPNRLPLSKVTKHSLTQWIAPLIGVDQEDRKAEFVFFGFHVVVSLSSCRVVVFPCDDEQKDTKNLTCNFL